MCLQGCRPQSQHLGNRIFEKVPRTCCKNLNCLHRLEARNTLFPSNCLYLPHAFLRSELCLRKRRKENKIENSTCFCKYNQLRKTSQKGRHPPGPGYRGNLQTKAFCEGISPEPPSLSIQWARLIKQVSRGPDGYPGALRSGRREEKGEREKGREREGEKKETSGIFQTIFPVSIHECMKSLSA